MKDFELIRFDQYRIGSYLIIFWLILDIPKILDNNAIYFGSNPFFFQKYYLDDNCVSYHYCPVHIYLLELIMLIVFLGIIIGLFLDTPWGVKSATIFFNVIIILSIIFKIPNRERNILKQILNQMKSLEARSFKTIRIIAKISLR